MEGRIGRNTSRRTFLTLVGSGLAGFALTYAGRRVLDRGEEDFDPQKQLEEIERKVFGASGFRILDIEHLSESSKTIALQFNDKFLEEKNAVQVDLDVKRVPLKGYIQKGFRNTFIDYIAFPLSSPFDGREPFIAGYQFGDAFHGFDTEFFPHSIFTIKIEDPTLQELGWKDGKYMVIRDLAVIMPEEFKSEGQAEVLSNTQVNLRFVAGSDAKGIMFAQENVGPISLGK